MLGTKACFAADAPMRTPGGSVRADAVAAGMNLLSRDEFDPEGAVVAKAVEEVFVRQGLITDLRAGGRTIRSTFEHPFFVDGKGWTPLNRIAAGDAVWTEAGGWVGVDAVEETGEWETVYNFRIADFHTYFVGCDEWGFSVWAHNAECGVNEVRYAIRKAGGNLSKSDAQSLRRLVQDEAWGKLDDAIRGLGIDPAHSAIARLKQGKGWAGGPTQSVAPQVRQSPWSEQVFDWLYTEAQAIKGAKPHGPHGRPGHPYAHYDQAGTPHAVADAEMLGTLNNWERAYLGINDNGRGIIVFRRGEHIVITPFDGKNPVRGGMHPNTDAEGTARVITSYSTHDKWAGDPNYALFTRRSRGWKGSS